MNRELPRKSPKIEFFKGSQLVTETSPCKTNVRNAFSVEIYTCVVIFTLIHAVEKFDPCVGCGAFKKKKKNRCQWKKMTKKI